MKRPSTGVTAHARTRIIGRCRATAGLAEGVAFRLTQAVMTYQQKAPENRGPVCLSVVVRRRPVRDNHGGSSFEMIVDANLDGAEFGGTRIEVDSSHGIILAS